MTALRSPKSTLFIVTLQYSEATVNVLMANSNYEIVVSFDRINKLDQDYREGEGAFPAVKRF